jgi:hypothetical protein
MIELDKGIGIYILLTAAIYSGKKSKEETRL